MPAQRSTATTLYGATRQTESKRTLLMVMLALPLAILVSAALVYGWVAYAVAALIAAVWIVVATNESELGVATLVFLISSFISQDSLPTLHLGGSFRPTDLVLGFTLFLVLTKPAVTKSLDLVHTPLDLPVLLWVSAAVLTCFTAVGSGATFVAAIPEARNLIYYLVFFTVTQLVRDGKSLTRLVVILFVLGFLTALGVIAQAMVGPSVHLIPGFVYEVNVGAEEFAGVSRVEAPGSILIQCLTVGMLTAWMMRRVPISFPVYIGVLSIMLTAVILPFYRSLWISLLIPIAIVFLLLPNARKARVLLTALIVIPSLLVFFGLLGSVSDRIGAYTGALAARSTSLTSGNAFTNGEDTWQSRLKEVTVAIPVIADHPLLGVGFAVPWRAANRFYGDVGTFTHNGYLWILVKMGVVGMLPFLLMMTTFIVHGLRQWRRVRHPFYQPLSLAFTMAFVGLLVGFVAEPRFTASWKWTTALAAIMGINEVIYRLYASDMDAISPQETINE